MKITHLTFGLLVAAASQGCVIEAVRDAYATCVTGEACGSGTTCRSPNLSVGGSTGLFCSTSCTRGEQCPSSNFGSAFAPTCVIIAPASVGVCYDTCATNADCHIGTRCASVAGSSILVCVPN